MIDPDVDSGRGRIEGDRSDHDEARASFRQITRITMPWAV